MSLSHLQLLLSAVTGEFASHRESLAGALRRAGVEVKTQEDFPTTGLTTLEKLDRFIEDCDAVLHLVGERTGAIPSPQSVDALRRRRRDLTARLAERLPALAVALAAPDPRFSFTQWEAYLAIYHGKPLFIYYPAEREPRDEPPADERTGGDAEQAGDALPADDAERERQRAVQRAHFRCICDVDRDRDAFRSEQDLCVKVLADLNQLAPPPDPEVSPTRLRHVAQHLVGRDEALRRLDDAWASPETGVVVIRAFGGVGKTSLVAAWMGQMAAEGWRRARRVFDWTFYSQGTRQAGQDADKAASADLFIATALRSFGDPDPQLGSPWDRGARLAKLVAASRTLLVLDGLEPLQHPPGALAGKIKDDAVCALLKGLCQHNRGVCIVTTRERVPDLQNFYGRTAIDWELDYLSDEAGAELLHSLGVGRAGRAAIAPDDEELRHASREVRGHALTLQLMGNYLHLVHDGDVRQRHVFDFADADPHLKTNTSDRDSPYGHAFKVMAAYETWLAGGGVEGRRQLAILRLLGFFDRPADPGCLVALRAEPAIAGLTDALVGITDAEWKIAIKRLEDIRLVTRVEYQPPRVRGYSQETAQRALEQGVSVLGDAPEFTSAAAPRGDALEAHPLLREYFAYQLKVAGTLRVPSDGSPALVRDENVTCDLAHNADHMRSVPGASSAWREGHRRLFEHLQSRVPYWPEGLDGLQPLYQAVAHGCQAGLHEQAAALVHGDRIRRGDLHYSMKALGGFSAELGAISCFFDQPWCRLSASLSTAAQAWLLNEAACCLRALGRLSDAQEPLRASLEMNIQWREWNHAAAIASNLSELQLKLGNITAAVASGEQSVRLADRGGNGERRLVNRTTHADAVHQAGDVDESRQLFDEAEWLQALRQPDHPRLYSLRGFQYCDLLLRAAERAAWQRMMCLDAQSPDVESQDACHAVATRAAQTLEWVIPQRWLLDIALDHLTLSRAALYCGLVGRAQVSDVRSQVEGHLTAAVNGLRQAGQMDELPQGLLTRAWLYYVTGDADATGADLDEAWEIAERGSMRLYMADIQLYRARLFRDRTALAEAAKIIHECGYHRRDDELADAQAAANTWQ